MRKLYLAMGMALVAMLVAAGAAYAAVTLNSDGTGFVGKGDVQLAFGWNNKQLQNNASSVTFTYNSTDTYSAVCRFTDGSGQVRTPTRTSITTVDSTLNGDPRQVKGQNQFTGFNLLGFGTTSTTGDVPVNGESCPGGPSGDGKWENVQLVSSEGGLYANYGSTSVLLQ